MQLPLHPSLPNDLRILGYDIAKYCFNLRGLLDSLYAAGTFPNQSHLFLLIAPILAHLKSNYLRRCPVSVVAFCLLGQLHNYLEARLTAWQRLLSLAVMLREAAFLKALPDSAAPQVLLPFCARLWPCLPQTPSTKFC